MLGSTDTVTWAVLNPMSGAYEGLGPNQRQGVELAIQQINDGDEFDFTIEATYEDTGTDPATATEKAATIIEEDGASFVTGAISSQAALELNGFAADNGVVYTPGAAAIPITGAQCNEYVFRFETNTAQIAEACAPWTVRNLGGKVWFHIADYAYGQSVFHEWRSRMQGISGFEGISTSRSELGTEDFGSYITDIKESDADVVVAGMTGGDLALFLQQAHEQGLKDAVEVMTTTGSFQSIRGSIGPAAAGVYSGVRYLPKLTTGDNPEFASAYEEQYDATPDSFARVGYESIRTVAKGIREAGAADPDAVKDVLPGLEMNTLFGQNRFRDCDHQAINPVWVGRNTLPSGEDVTDVKLQDRIDGEQAIPPCNESGCEL